MKLLGTVALSFLCWNLTSAQVLYSASPFITQNVNTKSLALANAVVSLDGEYADKHMNPSGMGIPSVLQITGNYSEFGLGDEHSLSFFELNFKVKRLGVGFSYESYSPGNSLRLIARNENDVIGKIGNKETYVTGVFNYDISNFINVGIAVNYISSTEGFSFQFWREAPESNFFSYDLGIQGKVNSYKIKGGTIEPTYGISITDFGAPQNYNYSEDREFSRKDFLPTNIKTGIGVEYRSDQSILDRNLFSVKLLGNLSKFLGRYESVVVEESDRTSVYIKPIAPFKALVQSWDTYQYYDGQSINEAKTIEQISSHIGIEFAFIETIFFRYGNKNAATPEEWLSYNSYGFGIDLFYLSIDYTYLKYKDFKPFYSFYPGHHWQITGRIPLNGKGRDTILDQVFK
jgi:hypothetical protein